MVFCYWALALFGYGIHHRFGNFADFIAGLEMADDRFPPS
jgi:hypothetical protein